MKLKEGIQSNSLKIIDLYNKIDAGLLDTSPTFQRKLVWKKQHKFSFIQTILWNYPFPEVYVASAEMDVTNLKAHEIVVDGQQRLTTIVDYIKGIGDFANQKRLVSFDKLTVEEKKDFLNYSVTVKDLKSIGMDTIKEIFRRINSTDYSLNSNEEINARFGDGEFAIFCKQLADKNCRVTVDDTDVIINNEIKEYVNTFFEKNRVFTENDIKRMFDSQYLMLISSTLLEGNYFSRTTRINFYLEKYNSEFKNYQDVLRQIVNSLKIIDQLKFSEESYWFNKPNLFNLIVELSKIEPENINFEILEKELVDLEEKVDIYFTGNEHQVRLLSADETRFFEVSRQGSNELAARQHRAKVIKEIILKATGPLNSQQIDFNNALSEREYVKIIPTATGLSKSIMDATSTVREFLKSKGVHDYDTQEFGPLNKKKIRGFFVSNNENIATEVSLYRSNGRGDYRIWFSDLTKFAKADDLLGLTYEDSKLHIYNLSRESPIQEGNE